MGIQIDEYFLDLDIGYVKRRAKAKRANLCVGWMRAKVHEMLRLRSLKQALRLNKDSGYHKLILYQWREANMSLHCHVKK
jgi:hypothetical protein